MSQWTHVAGIVRLDAIRPLNPESWRLPGIILREAGRYLPYGSEGPLELCLWENPDPNSMAAYALSFWGDLRDFDSWRAVSEWLKDFLDTRGTALDGQVSIRQLAAEVAVEGQTPVLISFSSEDAVLRFFHSSLETVK